MRFLFRDVVIDAGTGDLTRGGSLVRVQPKVLEFLLYLLRLRSPMRRSVNAPKRARCSLRPRQRRAHCPRPTGARASRRMQLGWLELG